MLHNIYYYANRDEVGVVTEMSKFLMTTQVSSGLNNSIFSSLANVKYYYVKTASLGTVKLRVTIVLIS